MTNSTSDVNREHVLDRLSQVNLPAILFRRWGTDWSPVGQIYWYTLGRGEQQPRIRRDGG